MCVPMRQVLPIDVCSNATGITYRCCVPMRQVLPTDGAVFFGKYLIVYVKSQLIGGQFKNIGIIEVFLSIFIRALDEFRCKRVKD
jgi:hypothetical protein